MRTITLAALIAILTSGSATGQVFFGEDINTTSTGLNEDAVRVPHPNADAAQAGFAARLTGVSTETFETRTAGAFVSSLTFGADTATLTPGLQVLDLPTGTFNGVWPVSGTNVLLQATTSANTFAIDFSSPQAAFGFYATDIEIPGNLTLRFLLADGATTVDRVVPTLAGTGGVNNTGSVVFFGVVDAAQPFIRVSFLRTIGDDGFGFDDLTIARAADVLPTTFAISGEVRDLNDTGVPDVTIALTGSVTANATSDLDGRFSFTTLPAGGTYTLTPSRPTFTFNPASQTFPSLAQDETAAFFVAQVGTFTRYFAEGATGPFFDTSIALLNATDQAANTTVRFLKPDGSSVAQALILPPLRRATVDPELLPGLSDTALATVIESDQPLIADRTMTWDARGYGSHAETSIARPLTQWYLAEGATIGDFNLFYLIQNPTAQDADVEVTFLLPSPAAPIVKTYVVTAQSRFNVWVNLADPALASAEMSAVITATNGVPIIVERAMYLTRNGRMFDAGHESAAIADLSTHWYLAEGATGNFFDLFILVANPNPQDAQLDVRYLLADGTVLTKAYTAPANSRFNIWVDLEDPLLADAAVSTTITSTNDVPVLVERAMWWPGTSDQWFEGHNSAGAVRTGEKWGLADGEVGGPRGVETYVLIANTSTSGGTARVQLIFEDGTVASQDIVLPATSRTNVAVGAQFPEALDKRFGVIVESIGTPAAQIVVERAVYNSAVLDGVSVPLAAGSNSLGTRLR